MPTVIKDSVEHSSAAQSKSETSEFAEQMENVSIRKLREKIILDRAHDRENTVSSRMSHRSEKEPDYPIKQLEMVRSESVKVATGLFNERLEAEAEARIKEKRRKENKSGSSTEGVIRSMNEENSAKSKSKNSAVAGSIH